MIVGSLLFVGSVGFVESKALLGFLGFLGWVASVRSAMSVGFVGSAGSVGSFTFAEFVASVKTFGFVGFVRCAGSVEIGGSAPALYSFQSFYAWMHMDGCMHGCIDTCMRA